MRWESSIPLRVLVVVNPASGGGATGRHWPAIRASLAKHFDFEVAVSQYPGHAVEIGRYARVQGFDRLVCVGGDGTLHELVNGAYPTDSANPMPELGIVPSGTGADFVRSAGISRKIESACARLSRPERLVSDLGVVSFSGSNGPETRYFVNAAGVGYDAEVVRRRNGFNRYIRGTIPYLASLAATLLTYENREISVTVGERTSARTINALVMAIGRYFGGGMRIAPDADLSDGLFDVVTIGNVGRLELLFNFPTVYRGTHLSNPKVSVERARAIEVKSPRRTLIQADGELLGETPARFEIVSRALTFLC